MPLYLACNTFPAVYKVWKYPSSAAAAADGGGVCVCVYMYTCMLICPYICTQSCNTHACVYVFEHENVAQPGFKLSLEPRMAERLILLLLPPLYWDYRCGPPDLVAFEYLKCYLIYIFEVIFFLGQYVFQSS